MAISVKAKTKKAKSQFKSQHFLVFTLVFAFLLFGFTFAATEEEIKMPNVAGSFYPDDPHELSQMIDGFLAKAKPLKIEGRVFALIVPHAGYGFSGQTAAYAFSLIKLEPYKTVIVLSPSHRYGFSGASVYPQGAFRTPLGDLKIDEEFCQKLLEDKSRVFSFAPAAFKEEHALEVELPFLQKVLSDFKIVPIVLGDCSFQACQDISLALKNAIGSREDILVIASTDMYHGYDYDECNATDKKTLSVLKNMDAQGLYYGLRDSRLQLCGGFGTVVTLLLAKELGLKDLKELYHTNSAITTGKRQKGIWTVGYASCVIAGTRENTAVQEKGADAMLNKAQRKKLLELARKSIENYLAANKKLEVQEEDPVLLQEMGAFVTLHEHGQLRGCIGNLIGSQPLYLTVRDMAVEAAAHDSRFLPLEAAELKEVEIEISVLSPMHKVSSADEIELGRHGVLIRKGFKSGVFLPQVATETGWPKEEFLSQLCSQKAGLPADAWKDKSTDIYVYTAEVFSEREY